MLTLLANDSLDDGCPAAPNFDIERSPLEIWADHPSPCDICRSFVGIKKSDGYGCPCTILGTQEAEIRSLRALLLKK